MEDMAAAKRALRTQMNRLLRDVSPESVATQSRSVTQNVLRMPQYQAARRISIYLSMPKAEIQTSDIVRDALKAGKTVFVPYVEKTNPDMGVFALADIEDFDGLQRDNWGIPSLPRDSLPHREVGNEDLDLILMPAMAFNRSTLNRLGHGKGYYDRFISSYAARNSNNKPLLGKLTSLMHSVIRRRHHPKGP